MAAPAARSKGTAACISAPSARRCTTYGRDHVVAASPPKAPAGVSFSFATVDVVSKTGGAISTGTGALVKRLATTAGSVSCLLLAACSAPATKAQPTPSPTATPLAALASKYLSLVDPANRAYYDLGTALCFSNASGCVSANMAGAQPLFRTYLSALTTLNDQLPLFQASLPASAQADLGQYRQSIAVEIADLDNVIGDTVEAQFWADESRWAPETFRTGAADKLVRADLHVQ
jgi:hypothetical protein